MNKTNCDVLIVEDEHEISRMLSDFLGESGWITDSAADGDDASEKMRNNSYDLILMDLMLPKKSGEELIRELRTYSDTPVIVISARSMLQTRLEVLRIGADDYILKPFNLSEVLVRMEVVLRRTGNTDSDEKEVIKYSGLTFNISENRVFYDKNEVTLTAKELMILRLFMEYPKKVYSKVNLYESVWKEEYCCDDNTITVHVSNLRSKLKKISGKDYIETVWGIGYRMKEE